MKITTRRSGKDVRDVLAPKPKTKRKSKPKYMATPEAERAAIVAYLRLLADYIKNDNPYTSPDTIAFMHKFAESIEVGQHVE